MYLDDVVIAGLIVVVLTTVVVVYASKYMISHMKEDQKKHEAALKADKTS